MKKLFILSLGLTAALATRAQDLHFARHQELRSWYNQALQTSRTASGTLNYRTLDYQGIIAFRTATALADVPLIRKEKREAQGGFLSLTAGTSQDRSPSQVLRNTAAVAGVSYAVPVNRAQNTYVSAGFQGSLFQSRVNVLGATFPDQYDKYRLVPNRMTSDPYTSSEVHYWSLNAGVGVFHNTEQLSWYAGASVRHLNEPEASNATASSYRLPRTISAQLGYSRALNEDERVGVYTSLNWKARAYEHVVNVQYNREFNRQGWDRGLGVGVGYRYGDAIIPNVEFRLAKTSFGFNYDVNVGSIRAAGMRRTSMEVGMKHRF